MRIKLRVGEGIWRGEWWREGGYVLVPSGAVLADCDGVGEKGVNSGCKGRHSLEPVCTVGNGGGGCGVIRGRGLGSGVGGCGVGGRECDVKV